MIINHLTTSELEASQHRKPTAVCLFCPFRRNAPFRKAVTPAPSPTM
ncbi:MAG: hypothetical protein IPH31_00250 [Lewinellaceae bacterium]|nr:hypothetical protein [Lewinellaceae bacterium]